MPSKRKSKSSKRTPGTPQAKRSKARRKAAIAPKKSSKVIIHKVKKRPRAAKIPASGSGRSYSDTTLKELWGLSGNQCAYPECTNPLIEKAKTYSRAAIVGHICHIYAFSDDGPRGKSGLTIEEKNSPQNLILMCGHHHPVIDKQYADYPAPLLIKWKKEHEAKAHPGTAEAIKREADIQKHAFIQQMSDEQIDRALLRIRQGRLLQGFPTLDEAKSLANQIELSTLSGGSDIVRARALAWCSRFLARADTDRAKVLLKKSRELGLTEEASIAEAFIEAETDKVAALRLLSQIDSGAARSAALRVVTNADGPEKSLAWSVQAGIGADTLDAEGKHVLINNALAAGNWDAAKAVLAHVTQDDYEQCPAIAYGTAMTNVVSVVPEELRAVAITQVPFEAQALLLGASPADIKARRTAIQLFERLSSYANEMGVAPASNIASDYALWLRLRDPTDSEQALTDLRESMRDPATSLRRLNLAQQFGINVDRAAIEARIEQSRALTGKGTPDDAFALFSLAFAQGSYKGLADYIDKHRDQLYEHLQKFAIQSVEIEALAKAGLIDTAKEKLDAAKSDGLPEREVNLLKVIIAEASGADPVAERRAAYEAAPDLRSLVSVAHALEHAQLWQDLLPYAQKLFEQSRSVPTCELVARSLDALHRYAELYEFLSKNHDLVEQSINLKGLWVWTLYREGEFARARELLPQLPPEHPNTQALKVNIAVASGAWDHLTEYCSETWEGRDNRSASELMHAAQLSVAINGPHSRDLAFAAVEKEPDNPAILIGAYSQATTAGWEHEATVGGWLNRAANLSADNGPIKKVSLKEIIEQKPDWDRQVLNVSEELRAGRLPVFAANHILNRSLLDFYLEPSLLNPTEKDVRKRRVIYAYSGARVHQRASKLESLALDLTSIITLARLELLTLAVETFNVLIPHSTLGWLFEERQKATFHQPSRIKDARLRRQLIANGTLQVLKPNRSQDHGLINEIGTELADLLSAARTRTADNRRTLVVRPAPLHKVGSTTGEPAVIMGYDNYVCSCSAVVDWLSAKAALTVPDEARARSFLKLQEIRWPSEPVIDDKTTLYLDGLAVSHLQAAGILEQLTFAGLQIYVTNEQEQEITQLLAIESLGDQQLSFIEKIRDTLAKGISSGRIRAVRTENVDEESAALFKLHPTYSVLNLATKADALVVDDRYINQHPTVNLNNGATPLLCTLDLLEEFKYRNVLSQAQVYAHRITLRQCGYQLVPLTADELLFHLANTKIANGELVETAELRAIRESLLRARISKLVQIPLEVPFLHGSLGAYIRAAKTKWSAATLDESKVYANYMLAMADIRGWSASALPGNERGFATFAYGSSLLQITSPPINASEIDRDAYYEWITDVLLTHCKEYQPECFAWIVARSKELTIAGTESAIQEARHRYPDDKNLEPFMLSLCLKLVPPIVRDELLADKSLIDRYGLPTEAVVSMAGVMFARSGLFGAIRKAVKSTKKIAKVADQSNSDWNIIASLKGAAPTLRLTRQNRSLDISHLLLVSDNRSVRSRTLEIQIKRTEADPAVAQKWRKIVKKRALSAAEMPEIGDEMSRSSAVASATISDALQRKNVRVEMLVPRSLGYYESLVGAHTDQKDVAEYAADIGSRHLTKLMHYGPVSGLKRALLLSSHSLFTKALAEIKFPAAALREVVEWAASTDVLSRGGALEVALIRSTGSAKFNTVLSALAEGYCSALSDAKSPLFGLLSETFMMVYGELAQIKITASKPPYWRRLAAFAQAALIARCAMGSNVDIANFGKWMRDIRVREFFLQWCVDLRTEPMCLDNFVLPFQLKNEFGGRVLLAAMGNKDSVSSSGLDEKLLGDVPSSLKSQINIHLARLPGPLEGRNLPTLEFPSSEMEKMRKGLETSTPTVSTFTTLIANVQLFRFPPDIPDLAADAIHRSQYRINAEGEKDKLAPCLTGLAVAAAVMRSHKLCDALHILCANYLNRFKDELGVEPALHIGLIASASREDFADWCKSIGNIVSHLGFSNLTQQEAAQLLPLMTQLCDLVPELWSSCGQGIGAIEAAGSA